VLPVKILHVLATAYCLTGTTASGSHTHPGTVAVDPAVIRMGAHLRIPGYGRGHAEDTGGAIRGNHIDVWFGSCARARQWGVRHLTIRVSR
jgi:3D (Asp-Asp-Asp) domain-containing protein